MAKEKNIDKLSPIQIGEYLNTGGHNHPIIMKHGNGYDLHYSNDGIEYKFEDNLTLKEVLKRFKRLFGK